MRRFFLQQAAISAELIVVTGTEARHITSVLRLKSGQAVEFFDGKGSIFSAVLEKTEKNMVTAVITAVRQDGGVAASPLTVAQCLLKGKKMDLLIQKATELGVHSFMPVVSRYCENHGDRRHQEERWQRIMIEACKQCHRAAPMRIEPVEFLENTDFSACSHRLAAWEQEQSAALPTPFIEHPGAICLFLGPEGGLHSEDLQILQQQQFATFSLGPRILRGETAALAAMAIIQYLTGTLQPAAGIEPDPV
jgi:16S rRNA (uracil1498-N3)-methyltransferase